MKDSTLNTHSVDDTKLTDHHALIITENVPEALPEDEQAIYDLIGARMCEAVFRQVCESRYDRFAHRGGVPFQGKGIASSNGRLKGCAGVGGTARS